MICSVFVFRKILISSNVHAFDIGLFECTKNVYFEWPVNSVIGVTLWYSWPSSSVYSLEWFKNIIFLKMEQKLQQSHISFSQAMKKETRKLLLILKARKNVDKNIKRWYAYYFL